MRALGIDTSNYTTSAAVFDGSGGYNAGRLLEVRPGELGLRQSDALFQHIKHLPGRFAELQAEGWLTGLSAVGASTRPRAVEGSYMPCFLVGVNAATAFSLARGIPMIQTTHQQGHAAAAMFAAAGPELFGKELLIFHVSGGTTDLLHCDEQGHLECLGTSGDLYAGQAVDRLGVRLGYGFPAGAQVSELAARCAESIRPKASVQGMNCSLSGLQNQCEKLLQEGRAPEYVCKYCLLCVAETLRRMCTAAQAQYSGLPVVFAGGVMSSDLVRQYITHRIPQAHFVPGKFASDNAIGVSILAAREVGEWPSISR